MSLNMQLDAEVVEAKWAEPSLPARAGSQWWPILLIVLPMAAANFAIPSLMQHLRPTEPAATMVYICLGLIPAEAALLSIGLVFGSGAFSWRLAIHWGSATLLCLSSFGGLWYSISPREIPERSLQFALQMACLLPLIGLATQAPLWLARFVLGWRLAGHCPPRLQLSLGGVLAALSVIGAVLGLFCLADREDRRKVEFCVTVCLLGTGLAVVAGNAFSPAKRTAEEVVAGHAATGKLAATQLTIRDLFIATAVIAVSLGLARAIPLEPFRAASFWAGAAVFAAICSGLSLLLVVPMLWLFFTRIPLWATWSVSFAYVGVYVAVFFLLSAVGVFGFFPLDVERLAPMTGIASLIVGTACGLTLLRLNGVQLMSGR